MTEPRAALEVTHRKVWLLAGPIILSNISVPLVGAVDTAVVGHLPDPRYIGAVALGALIFSFLYWGFGFLRMGTSGFVAQAFGAGDWPELHHTLIRVLLLAVVLGLFTILISRPLIEFALYLLESSAAVEGLARDYAHIRIWSAPAVLCVYAFTGIFVGLHNMRAAFALQLILNIANMLLDVLFVLGFGWGVEGVALASLIAEYLAMLAGFYLLRYRLRNALQACNRARLLHRAALVRLFQANSNIFIRTLALLFALGYFTAMSARQGEVILAANAIMLHLQSIMAHGLDGFATAVEALAGSAYGAGRRRAFRRAVLLTSLWGGVIAIMTGIGYLLGNEAMIRLFTSIDSVVETALIYLPWMIAMPIVSIWCYQLDGIFIGTSHTREMRNAMAVSLAAYLALLQWLIPAFGNHGLYLGLAVFMLLRALSLLFYYPRIESSMPVEAEPQA
ncbi:MAG: MATE family efflux transporter [Gammaproteobacteria bacterium]|nr:MATE family efflux transporter [Gammaproteobacteria bacterium]MDH3449407.1 MATE family efflux transporter [Gammaproteobacteria bacterium]